MATSEFKTAAAKLLDQHAANKPAAVEMDETPAQNPAPRRKTPVTPSMILSLAKTRLSLGLAVLCCGGMWLVVPELLIPKSFKIFNAVLGIVMGLTYGIILSFPHNGEGGKKA